MSHIDRIVIFLAHGKNLNESNASTPPPLLFIDIIDGCVWRTLSALCAAATRIMSRAVGQVMARASVKRVLAAAGMECGRGRGERRDQPRTGEGKAITLAWSR